MSSGTFALIDAYFAYGEGLHWSSLVSSASMLKRRLSAIVVPLAIAVRFSAWTPTVVCAFAQGASFAMRATSQSP